MKEKKNTLEHDIDALIKSHFEREIENIEEKPLPAEVRKSIPGTWKKGEGQRHADRAWNGPDGAGPVHSEHRLRDILFKAAGIALIIILPSLAVIKRHEETPLSGSIADAWKSEDLGTKVMSGLSRLQNIYHNTQK